MPLDANANQKGGPPDPYPSPNQPLPARNMSGIGKGPQPEDTSNNIGVREQELRTRMYRGEK